MNALLEFLPIVAFFAVYKTVGGLEAVYPATGAAIVTALLVTLYGRLRHGHFERRRLVMLGAFVVLGGLTLALHDPRYIKLKPTVVSWVTGLLFLGSQFIGSKTLIERAFSGNLSAPPAAWRRLNLAWVGFFALMGALNLYVASYYSTDFWVNFKVFGVLGLTFAFAVLQGFYLMRYDDAATDSSRD